MLSNGYQRWKREGRKCEKKQKEKDKTLIVNEKRHRWAILHCVRGKELGRGRQLGVRQVNGHHLSEPDLTTVSSIWGQKGLDWKGASILSLLLLHVLPWSPPSDTVMPLGDDAQHFTSQSVPSTFTAQRMCVLQETVSHNRATEDLFSSQHMQS